MPATRLTTYKDLLDHAVAYLGGNVTQEALRSARIAVLSAYRELGGIHDWRYFQRRTRITTVDDYSTGTIQYTHTGGAFERLVILTSGTWPATARFGKLTISSTVYEVATRESDTQITLSINSNPGANVASGTSYNWYRDSYPLPVGFVRAGRFINQANATHLEFVTPETWLLSQWSAPPSPGIPRQYSIFKSEDHAGLPALYLYPPPDAIYNLDAICQFLPRPLAVEEYRDGKVSNTAGSATLTGSNTTFLSKHVGAVVRLGSTSDYPTGPEGGNVYSEERIILARPSATQLTLDAAITDANTSVYYTISDPADIEEGPLLSALHRCIEKHLAIQRIMKNRQEAMDSYRMALILAMEHDSPNSSETNYGGRGPLRSLRDYPSGSQLSGAIS